MVTKVFEEKEFFNGLVYVCASGIGEDVEIPDQWPNEADYMLTRNAIFLDVRSFNIDDLDVRASIYLTDEDASHEEILTTDLELPMKRLYIGDVTGREKQIIPAVTEKIRLEISINRSTVPVSLYLKMSATIGH